MVVVGGAVVVVGGTVVVVGGMVVEVGGFVVVTGGCVVVVEGVPPPHAIRLTDANMLKMIKKDGTRILRF